MSEHSKSKNGITHMTITALDIEELEQRLELATAATSCDCCGGKVEACGVQVKQFAPGGGAKTNC